MHMVNGAMVNGAARQVAAPPRWAGYYLPYVRRGSPRRTSAGLTHHAANLARSATGANTPAWPATPPITRAFSSCTIPVHGVPSSRNSVAANSSGGPAVAALYYNRCGWSNPSGLPAGGTPFFYYVGEWNTPPGADAYVNAASDTAAAEALIRSPER